MSSIHMHSNCLFYSTASYVIEVFFSTVLFSFITENISFILIYTWGICIYSVARHTLYWHEIREWNFYNNTSNSEHINPEPLLFSIKKNNLYNKSYLSIYHYLSFIHSFIHSFIQSVYHSSICHIGPIYQILFYHLSI